MNKKLWTGFKDEWLESFSLLEKEELLEILNLLVQHKNEDSVNLSNCSRMVQVVWSTYQGDLDRMADISKKRSEAALKSVESRKANVDQQIQTAKENALPIFAKQNKANDSKLNVCLEDKDKDRDKDRDKGKDTDKESLPYNTIGNMNKFNKLFN